MTSDANATDAPRRPVRRRLARAAGVAVLVAVGLFMIGRVLVFQMAA